MKVLGRSIRHGDGRSYHHATVSLGAPHSRSLRLPVSVQLYAELRAGGEARLTVEPGTLGRRWVIAIAPPP